jgi:hypothetical protein
MYANRPNHDALICAGDFSRCAMPRAHATAT